MWLVPAVRPVVLGDEQEQSHGKDRSKNPEQSTHG